MAESNLTQKRCRACEGTENALSSEQVKQYLALVPQWQLAEEGRGKISRKLVMRNFKAAVDLINEITKIAEAENHHPDIHLVNYRQLRIDLSTHAVNGLSENDFIMAAKINELPMELKQ